MKIWMLFGTLTYFLIVVVFGYSLSSNIEGNIENMIFWMLYISTIFTISILVGSFFMSLTLKDLKGMPGERGEMGEPGEQGKNGTCEVNCRDKIGYNIIMDAIKNRLMEFEAIKRGEGNDISEIQRKMNDHIKYYDNMNLSVAEIIRKLKKKYEKQLKPDNKDNEEYKKYITKEHIKKVLSNDYITGGKDFEINNSYIKEKVKTILDSDEFREMASYRGPLKLIEYIKDLWLKWIELIYNASNINYFTSVGAENDFERFEDNPFNEIKKYEVFNWGLSNKTRPRVVNVKAKNQKKVELKNEGFEDYTNITTPKMKANDMAHPDNKGRLKIIRSNDYYFTYDDIGTTMKEQIRSYRPYSKIHNGDRYYPLGDIVVGPVKDNADDENELIFSDTYDNKSRTFKKKGKTIGPNRDTILVAGDVKKPLRYETKWYDLQKKMTRHWTCKLCKKHPRNSYYKGIAHTPVCPTGYTSLGDTYTSQDNQTPELKKRTNQFGTYEPIYDNQPVCIPNECVEVIEDKDPQIIWDTYRSQRPAFGSGDTNWFKYVVDNAEIYSLSPDVGKKGHVKATHNNSYNLSKIWLEDKKFKKHKIIDEWAVKDSYKEEDYLKNLEEQEQELETQLLIDQEENQEQEESRENFQIFMGLLISGITTLAKGLEKPLMIRPHMYRIKDECIIKDDGNINLGGDDYKWPSILKEDKTGEPGEDATVFFISENEEERIIESIPKDIDNKISSTLVDLNKLKIYLNNIETLNKFFEENKFYKKEHIDILEENNKLLIELLENPIYEYKDEDYSLFYLITEYISFLSSLPSLSRYNAIKENKDKIHTAYRAIIDPINEEKLNKLKLKLGLGWKGIPRFDDKGEDYSMHHFFYIDNKGSCKIKNKELEFERIENYSDIFSLKIDDKYLTRNKKNIDKHLSKRELEKDNADFHFKLKFIGTEKDEEDDKGNNIYKRENIIIRPGNEIYKDYVLTYNNNNFKFLSDKEVKKTDNYKFEIDYSKK